MSALLLAFRTFFGPKIHRSCMAKVRDLKGPVAGVVIPQSHNLNRRLAHFIPQSHNLNRRLAHFIAFPFHCLPNDKARSISN